MWLLLFKIYRYQHFCFVVYIQHDADEVFLAILNLMHQQMDDEAVVGCFAFCLSNDAISLLIYI